MRALSVSCSVPCSIACSVLLTVLLYVPAANAELDNSAVTCSGDINFYPRGDHWAVIPGTDTDGDGIPETTCDTGVCDGPVPVVYRQQEGGSSDMTNTTAENAAITRGMLAWSQVPCTTADGAAAGQSNFSTVDGIVFDGLNYPTRDRGDIEATATDSASYKNIIYFVTDAAAWGADSLTVALTTNLYTIDTGFIVTADMEFNNVDFHFRASATGGPANEGCAAGSANCYDVETVALHEAGHFFGLNHVTCADATMFPSTSGLAEARALSPHEKAAICALYPPRGSSLSSTRDFGEWCVSDGECNGNQICTLSGGAGSLAGWCTLSCNTDTDCPDAFRCETGSASRSYCKPGPHNTGGAVIGNASSDGLPIDMCQSCSAGSQCSSGLCVDDGNGSTICSTGCSPDLGTAACPSGMECVTTGNNTSVCWPSPGNDCRSTMGTREGVNALCYEENVSNPSSSYFAPCGPDLLCFGFRARCEGQQGRCVNYCNATDIGRSCGDGMECCYGVDDRGNCVTTPSAEIPSGGCFNIRREGESCVVAENSICASGHECVVAGDNLTAARCFRNCDQVCGANTSCYTFSSSDANCPATFDLCCDTVGMISNNCNPGQPEIKLDIGVKCLNNSDCDSNLCLSIDGSSACSRNCDVVTNIGCPSDDADQNGDGTMDGGFRCILSNNKGRCWPKEGPIAPPTCQGDTCDSCPLCKKITYATDEGCCKNNATSPSDLALFFALSLMVLIRRREPPTN